MSKIIFKRIIEIEKELDENYKTYPNISLFSGIGALPIFYFLLYRLTNNSDHLEKLHNALDEIFIQLNEHEINVSYCTGIAGISYMLNFLVNYGVLESEQINDSLDVMDEAIISYSLKHLNSIEDTDFLHGGLGVAHYLIERIKNNSALINKTVYIFEKLAHIAQEDLIKFEEVCSVKEFSDTNHKTNCGLAHGYIAYVIIFSKFLEQFPNNMLILSVLNKIINCVLSFESFDTETVSRFPGIAVNKNLADYNVPLAWCYGDQSIAYGFFKASQVLRNKELLTKSKEIIYKTLKRDSLQKSVSNVDLCDSSFCHGITSIAYLHKKGFQITNDQKCLDLYEYFTNELLVKGSGDFGLEGYQSFYKLKGFKKDFTFLNGLIGVGIFFIDYMLDNDEIKWEAILLLD
ncbi:lanthionine synthetase LanC family protein [Flavobacterium sp. KS-LB2]|uniref:lanthionine synthetase LanC family protein n=1 Tax=Flavobacterium sp. KS-LB2 TaxID=3120525 RepID=UPI0030D5359D